ncbi:hypothetical protein D3C83_75460 [compost metagenome]
MSRRTRIQALLGKWASIISCQVATGSRNAASLCHGTCSTRKPSSVFTNTVPENRSSNGISPSSRAWKYFDVATSKS